MNKSKLFLAGVLLVTSTVWAQPDEYLHEVEDSPTSKTALFDDSTEKPVENFMAAADPAVMGEEPKAAVVQAPPVKANTRARKATRGIASVAPAYDCAAAATKINNGEKLSKQEMSTYKKNCK